MQPNPTSLDKIYAEILKAVQDFDWDAVQRLAASYARGVEALTQLKAQTASLLDLLLKSRQYDAVMQVADAALTVTPDSHQLWRFYAQALVDRGRIAPALRLYTAIADDPSARSDDQDEGRGGIGRCYKQRFLSATHPDRRAHYLALAIDAYNTLYQTDPRRNWYGGINAAALLARADHDGLPIPGTEEDPAEAARRIAADVLAVVSDEQTPWAAATACEAHIALGNVDDALTQARIFVSDPTTYAFHVASFLRQVEELWQPEPDSLLGTTLIPLLRSALVGKHGGAVTLTGDDLTSARLEKLWQLLDTSSDTAVRLEKVLGTERFRTLQWWRKGLARCRAVVRIDDPNGVGVGTGFMIDGRALDASFPDRVVVTNGHVVPETVPPQEAVVAFHGLDEGALPPKFRVSRLWWYSPASPPGVDTTVLELDGTPDDVEPIPLAKRVPVFNEDSKAYIIGHPRGYDQPQFSIQDNKVLDRNDTYLHYRSPTEGGSSGSPVFESQWSVIGVHHAGGVTVPKPTGPGTHQANEALLINAIRQTIENRPDGWPVPGAG